MDTRAAALLDKLQQHYDPQQVDLDWHGDPWRLLVATVLAAQCTDARVNTVTPVLFDRWPTPAALAVANQEDLEHVVRPTGFFRNKAKNLIAAARMLTDDLDGQLPRTMKDMTKIPGVARKTANIVLTTGLGIVEGIAVDTHAKRLAFRMDFTDSDKPVQVEKDLMAMYDKSVWHKVNHLLVQHGRAVCTARVPKCGKCFLGDLCPRKGVEKSG